MREPSKPLGRNGIVSLQLAPSVGSMRVGAGGGGVNSLVSKDSRSFLRLRRHAAVVPT